MVGKMKNWKFTVFFTILIIGIVFLCGCTSTESTSATSGGVNTATQTCTIDNSQTGQIQILDFNFASAQVGADNNDKRVIGKAKNIGTNTISGTIEYRNYLENKKILNTLVYKFCNVQPNQEFQFIIPDVNIEAKNRNDCCYTTINAGQKITTTGKGPRVPPYHS
jgi:hypothetical protein